MEGQMVGKVNNSSPDLEREVLELLWPTTLIAELSRIRNYHPWSTRLALVSFILASLTAIAVGPVQLILLVVTEDYSYVTETYFPTALRISLLITGVIAICNLVSIIQTWREEPPNAYCAIALNLSSALISGVIWICALIIILPPHILSTIIIILILAGSLCAITFKSKEYDIDTMQKFLHIFVAILAALNIIELGASVFYTFSSTDRAASAEMRLKELGQAQAAARLEGVPAELSDLVYTICQSPYEIVYLPSSIEHSGIFECKNNHDVYAVSGPNDPITSSSTESVLLGSAFYFGTVKSEYVAEFFPTSSNISYLYRDLTSTEYPSELILIAPASDENALIENNLEAITNLANSLEHNLLLSIFYADSLNTIVGTKDYIILAAADTLAMINYLPNGNNIRGNIKGKYGSFVYTPDNALYALQDLGLNPLLYSVQTLESITNRRHITVEFSADTKYTQDSVREILWNGYRDLTPTTEEEVPPSE